MRLLKEEFDELVSLLKPDRVNYSYRNWSVRDDEETREYDILEEEGIEGYLGRFDNVELRDELRPILSKYPILSCDHAMSLDDEIKITDVLVHYIDHKCIMDVDFHTWECIVLNDWYMHSKFN